jgi:hypothetical protein
VGPRLESLAVVQQTWDPQLVPDAPPRPEELERPLACYLWSCAGERRKERGKKKKAGTKMALRHSSLSYKIKNEYFNRYSIYQQI